MSSKEFNETLARVNWLKAQIELRRAIPVKREEWEDGLAYADSLTTQLTVLKKNTCPKCGGRSDPDLWGNPLLCWVCTEAKVADEEHLTRMETEDVF